PRHPRRMAAADWETWAVFEEAYRRGTVRRIGVSNMGVEHLRELLERADVPPMAVQNRCFARTQWDREVRSLCAHHGVAYQGFSLLTANPFVTEQGEVRRIAQLHEVTPAQIVFAFARGVGMIPLTGTTNPRHMVEDLAAMRITLDANELRLIEHIAAD
ncbi:MAG: aldo/keto reductase, partial [Halofilum sp. (in: g-proteobacteria)]